MRVALLVLGVEAVRLDGELDRRLGGEVEGAVVAREAALDGRHPLEALDVEVDARTGRVDPPARRVDGGRADGVGRVRAHGVISLRSSCPAARRSDSAAGRPVTAQRWASLSGLRTMRTVWIRPSTTSTVSTSKTWASPLAWAPTRGVRAWSA